MAITTLEGDLHAVTGRFGIIVARWNELVTRKLLEGAASTLTRYGIPATHIEAVWVPGCWEVPIAAREMAMTGRFQALIALGTILQGETPHAQGLASALSDGLSRVSLDAGVPITWGILTCDNLDQALGRAGAKMGNKGSDAALAAIEMVSVLKKIREGK
jgi:6,7-dimethyl-8-ribityllumazine synthase